MLNGINSVLTIFSIIGIGFYFSKKGWFSEDTQKLFSKIVVNISLPAMTIYNMKMRFTREHLALSLKGIIISFASILLLYGLSLFIGKMLRLNKNQSSIFSVLFTFANTVFIGFPINISLFGEESITYALLYYLANTSLFWTLGVYILSSYNSESNNKFQFKYLKRVISPAFISLILGYIIVLLKIPLPTFLMDSCHYIGNLTVPLSMLFIGISLSVISPKSFPVRSTLLWWIIAGRFIVSPVIILFLMIPLNLPLLMQKVLILEAGMPVQAQAAIVAKYYEADSEFVSVAVGFSTFLSIIAIPIYSILLSIL